MCDRDGEVAVARAGNGGQPVRTRAAGQPRGDVVGRHDDRIVRLCVFFFQAEDGIRDLTVTGVQTCALPISFTRRGRSPRFRSAVSPLAKLVESALFASARPLTVEELVTLDPQASEAVVREIGRASCRERG